MLMTDKRFMLISLDKYGCSDIDGTALRAQLGHDIPQLGANGSFVENS